nr:hypothetical protein [Tanacetum cinerariifolium]
MPHAIARAICMHDYDMLPPSHGGTMTMTYEAPVVIGWCVPDTPSHGADPSTILLLEVPQDYDASSAVPCLFIILLCYSLSLYPFTERYAQPYFFSCLIRQRGVTIMVSEPGFETVGSKDLTCEDWMVNTRTDADLSAAVQNALQTLLPQIRAEIPEEFRTSSGPSDAGGNPSPVTIYTWLERFNKQKPRSFEKATAPVDAENW